MSALLVLVIMLFVQVSPHFPEGLVWKHIAWDALQCIVSSFMRVLFIISILYKLKFIFIGYLYDYYGLCDRCII